MAMMPHGASKSAPGSASRRSGTFRSRMCSSRASGMALRTSTHSGYSQSSPPNERPIRAQRRSARAFTAPVYGPRKSGRARKYCASRGWRSTPASGRGSLASTRTTAMAARPATVRAPTPGQRPSTIPITGAHRTKSGRCSRLCHGCHLSTAQNNRNATTSATAYVTRSGVRRSARVARARRAGAMSARWTPLLTMSSCRFGPDTAKCVPTRWLPDRPRRAPGIDGRSGSRHR